MNCPHHKVRSDLPPLTPRIAKLPVDERGYPIPFFVGYVGGKPEFRMADRNKLIACILQKLCWVCGQRLKAPSVFIIGPMCMFNRISAEPPVHEECALWSVKGCPFMAKPNMVRREHEKIAALGGPGAGMMITRNPGVMVLWKTRAYHTIKDRGSYLFKIGEPITVEFWREGRLATRDEVMESIRTGLPLLRQAGMPKEVEEHRMRSIEPLLPTR